MILEGIVTTLDAAGALNVAPMGPIVSFESTSAAPKQPGCWPGAAIEQLELRPFQSSQTYRNLKRHPCGVFHVIDDVLLIAQAALDRLPAIPETFPAAKVAGCVLANCCRWHEFEVAELDDSQERTHIVAPVVHTGRVRDFLGFNRAMHAVLEATILATRLHILPADEVRAALERLRSPVEKTAGPRELEAWRVVNDYVTNWHAQHPSR